MNWSQLSAEVAARSGVPPKEAHAVLSALVEVTLEALAKGDDVVLRGLGTLSSRWQGMRTLRSVSGSRKLMLDGRFVPRFRAASRLRAALLTRSPQRWRDPEHQSAWRIAETLIGDLALYHGANSPGEISQDTPLDEVGAACRGAFGGAWMRVTGAWEVQVSPQVRDEKDYLLLAARRRFGREA